MLKLGVDENFGRYFQVEINFTNLNRTSLIVPGVDGSASILLGKSVIEYSSLFFHRFGRAQ